jgi:hypothetical protein
MKTSLWPDGHSYPIYIDPTFDEIVELAKSQPDTLRVLEDEHVTALASGYGNTHDSVCKAVRLHLGNKRWLGVDYILFNEMHQWFINPLGHLPTPHDRVPYERCLKYFEDKTQVAIKDFVRVYDELFTSKVQA